MKVVKKELVNDDEVWLISVIMSKSDLKNNYVAYFSSSSCECPGFQVNNMNLILGSEIVSVVKFVGWYPPPPPPPYKRLQNFITSPSYIFACFKCNTFKLDKSANFEVLFPALLMIFCKLVLNKTWKNCRRVFYPIIFCCNHQLGFFLHYLTY